MNTKTLTIGSEKVESLSSGKPFLGWFSFESHSSRAMRNSWKMALKPNLGTSLIVQWLRIRLPMQGTQVRALVREDPTCHGATKPVCHNY